MEDSEDDKCFSDSDQSSDSHAHPGDGENCVVTSMKENVDNASNGTIPSCSTRVLLDRMPSSVDHLSCDCVSTSETEKLSKGGTNGYVAAMSASVGQLAFLQ